MNAHIVTIVEGVVPEEKWATLESGYAAILNHPPAGLVESCIVQGRSDPTLWRLITFWENAEKLKTMQQSHAVPPGIKIFRDVNVEPNVKIFDVKSTFSAK